VTENRVYQERSAQMYDIRGSRRFAAGHPDEQSENETDWDDCIRKPS